nr:hypothetical protein [Candidatus Freyarchaeota archaeon]
MKQHQQSRCTELPRSKTFFRGEDADYSFTSRIRRNGRENSGKPETGSDTA